MQKLNSKSISRLYKAILQLKTEEECAAFFDDLCTIMELQSMAGRLDAAILLDRKENYLSISKDIGISTATISRVSKCINYGPGGYKTVIDRLKDEDKDVLADYKGEKK